MTPTMFDCTKNRLLATFDRSGIEHWLPHLSLFDVAAGVVLVEPHVRQSHVFFPITAVISVRCMTGRDVEVEIAVIGREGFVGLPIVLGHDCSPDQAVVRVPGRVLKLPVSFVEAERQGGSPAMRHMLRFASDLLMQISHSAISDRQGLM